MPIKTLGKLTFDPTPKEPPQNPRMRHQTHHVPSHDLRAQRPPEEPKVARVPEHAVDAGSDQLVAARAPQLHLVVEIRPRLRHGRRAARLPDNHKRQAQENHDRCVEARQVLRVEALSRGRGAEVGGVAEQRLEQGERVRGLVRVAV